MKDLVILAADKDLRTALEALLKRDQSLGIRPITFTVFTEPGHDPACARTGVQFLDQFVGQFQRALLMFDYEGSGMEQTCTPDELQTTLDTQLHGGPWGTNAKTLLLNPELEAWVWSDSPQVSEAIRWKGSRESLTAWLIQEGRLAQGQPKPPRPKEAFDAALYAAGQPHSASLFGRLAENVSFRRCTDPSFDKFCQILREWFPRED